MTISTDVLSPSERDRIRLALAEAIVRQEDLHVEKSIGSRGVLVPDTGVGRWRAAGRGVHCPRRITRGEQLFRADDLIVPLFYGDLPMYRDITDTNAWLGQQFDSSSDWL